MGRQLISIGRSWCLWKVLANLPQTYPVVELLVVEDDVQDSRGWLHEEVRCYERDEHVCNADVGSVVQPVGGVGEDGENDEEEDEEVGEEEGVVLA